MSAWIEKGDILNDVEPFIKSIGDVVYLPTQYPFDNVSIKQNINNSIKNHSMDAVIAALKEVMGGTN